MGLFVRLASWQLALLTRLSRRQQPRPLDPRLCGSQHPSLPAANARDDITRAGAARVLFARRAAVHWRFIATTMTGASGEVKTRVRALATSAEVRVAAVLLAREGEDERGAVAELALDLDAAVVQLDDVAHRSTRPSRCLCPCPCEKNGSKRGQVVGEIAGPLSGRAARRRHCRSRAERSRVPAPSASRTGVGHQVNQEPVAADCHHPACRAPRREVRSTAHRGAVIR